MNVVKFESCAFILPDDMDAFRNRYGVDVLFLDGEEGNIMGLGPNDRDWREIPSGVESSVKVVKLHRDSE